MKKLIFSLFLCFALLEVHGQVNLVPNPSFEIYSQCPTEIGEFDVVDDWNTFRESPDYFNVCADTFVSVPCNRFGCQEPSSGNGYAGLYFFYTLDQYREIIGAKLIEPLTIGQTYFVTFKASPGYGSYFDVKWFSNKLGLKFSMNGYDINAPAPIDNFAHIYTNDIISDTSNWTTISDIFVADAPYEYLMLGNFFDNENTDTLTNGNSNYASYYYIDDVCVTTNPTGCDFISGIAEKAENNVMVYPNPVNDILHIESEKPIEKVAVYNSFGQLIFTKENFPNDDFNLNLEQIDAGIYFVKIRTQSSEVVQKIAVN